MYNLLQPPQGISYTTPKFSRGGEGRIFKFRKEFFIQIVATERDIQIYYLLLQDVF